MKVILWKTETRRYLAIPAKSCSRCPIEFEHHIQGFLPSVVDSNGYPVLQTIQEHYVKNLTVLNITRVPGLHNLLESLKKEYTAYEVEIPNLKIEDLEPRGF